MMWFTAYQVDTMKFLETISAILGVNELGFAAEAAHLEENQPMSIVLV